MVRSEILVNVTPTCCKHITLTCQVEHLDGSVGALLEGQYGPIASELAWALAWALALAILDARWTSPSTSTPHVLPRQEEWHAREDFTNQLPTLQLGVLSSKFRKGFRSLWSLMMSKVMSRL
jgi:hypothetical protein